MTALFVRYESFRSHSFRIPEKIDYTKLPCLDRIDAERYESRFLLECSEAVKGTRRAIIERAVLWFAPDLMIVDLVLSIGD